jgi:hypothetical protein
MMSKTVSRMNLLYTFICIGHHNVHGPDLRRRAWVVDQETNLEHRYNIYLCAVLRTDYQSTASCEESLGGIESVERGARENFIASGNAWMITITREGVQIDSHTVPWWDEQPEGHFTLAEFKAALEGWKRFLQMPVSLDSRLVITLPDSESAR